MLIKHGLMATDLEEKKLRSRREEKEMHTQETRELQGYICLLLIRHLEDYRPKQHSDYSFSSLELKETQCC